MKKRRKAQDKQPSSSLAPISKKRRWAFRFISLFLIPLVFFVCIEAALRIAGVGYPTEIVTKRTVNGKDRYCDNQRMGCRFFPRQIARNFFGFAFDVDKSSDTYRIFVLGASAALGVPEPAYGFDRFLEIMLEHEYPRTDFEVITPAMPAINSHAVYQIARSCAKFEPDLIVVYLGNNEVVGPYGAGTVLAPLSPNLAMIRAIAAMTRTRSGQLYQELLNAVGSAGKVPQSWGGMEMFLNEQVRADSESLKTVYSHFEQNLRDICSVGIKAGAQIILSNVGCNLKDSPPFVSLNRDGLAKTEKQQWDALYQQGIEQEIGGDYEQAVASYLAAVQIDDTFADLQFRLGRCYWLLGDYVRAKDRYVLAREYDALRFRADSRINQVIRSASEGRESEGVYFVDTVKALESNSPHQTPGNELFYEHVHYRFEGNYVLAKTVFEQVKKTLPEAIAKHKRNQRALTLAACENRMAYSVFDRFQMAEIVRNSLINKPPFTNQSYYDQSTTRLDNELDSLKSRIMPDLQSILSTYNEKIAQHPDDWKLRWKLANLYYRDVSKYDAARIELEKVVLEIPFIEAYKRLTRILLHQNKLDEAERYCRERIKINPFHAGAYFDLGNIFCKKGNPYDAAQYFTKAKTLRPGDSVRTDLYIADRFEKSGYTEKAVETLYQAIDNCPKEQCVMVYTELGLLLGRQNRNEEATQIIRTLITDFHPKEFKKEKELFAFLLKIDQIELAIELCRNILKVKPNSVAQLNRLGWILATCGDETIRKPGKAVQYAKKACTLTDDKSAAMLETLAAAYANSGDFESAIRTAQKAFALATQDGEQGLATRIEAQLRMYELRKMPQILNLHNFFMTTN